MLSKSDLSAHAGYASLSGGRMSESDASALARPTHVAGSVAMSTSRAMHTSQKDMQNIMDLHRAHTSKIASTGGTPLKWRTEGTSSDVTRKETTDQVSARKQTYAALCTMADVMVKFLEYDGKRKHGAMTQENMTAAALALRKAFTQARAAALRTTSDVPRAQELALTSFSQTYSNMLSQVADGAIMKENESRYAMVLVLQEMAELLKTTRLTEVAPQLYSNLDNIRSQSLREYTTEASVNDKTPGQLISDALQMVVAMTSRYVTNLRNVTVEESRTPSHGDLNNFRETVKGIMKGSLSQAQLNQVVDGTQPLNTLSVSVKTALDATNAFTQTMKGVVGTFVKFTQLGSKLLRAADRGYVQLRPGHAADGWAGVDSGVGSAGSAGRQGDVELMERQGRRFIKVRMPDGTYSVFDERSGMPLQS